MTALAMAAWLLTVSFVDGNRWHKTFDDEGQKACEIIAEVYASREDVASATCEEKN